MLTFSTMGSKASAIGTSSSWDEPQSHQLRRLIDPQSPVIKGSLEAVGDPESGLFHHRMTCQLVRPTPRTTMFSSQEAVKLGSPRATAMGLQARCSSSPASKASTGGGLRSSSSGRMSLKKNQYMAALAACNRAATSNGRSRLTSSKR